METYWFLSNKGEYVSVTASDEQTARRIAMMKLWGPIKANPSWLGNEWLGLGLMQTSDPYANR